MSKYYIIEVHYNAWTLKPSRVYLPLETSNKDEAEEYIKQHSGYTGPHYNKIIEYDGKCENNILQFGKYKGNDISSVSFDYLMWLYEDTDKKNSPIVKQEVIRRAKLSTEAQAIHNKYVEQVQRDKRLKEETEKEYWSTHRFELM